VKSRRGVLLGTLIAAIWLGLCLYCEAQGIPKVPRFSLDYMDKTVDPGTNFFSFAAGNWVKTNPVPANKSRWTGFVELQERNWFLIHELLRSCSTGVVLYGSSVQKVGDFYLSAIDTNRLEFLRFKPIENDLKKIAAVKSPEEYLRLLAELQGRGVDACFSRSVSADARNSGFYAFYLSQGGLGLPDRDYYLAESFAKQREAYLAHVERMFALLGEGTNQAKAHAATVLQLETELAKASKARADLRDPLANYHKYAVSDFEEELTGMPVRAYLEACGLGKTPDVVVRQPAFFTALKQLTADRPLEDWKTYLRWHLVRASAPYLHSAAEGQDFAFYGQTLREQKEQEPRWQRAAKMIDEEIGEALGELFVKAHFPRSARQRMLELVENVKAVFRERLQQLDWMTEPTRAKALAKFDRFTQKIGHPEKFRDYSAVEIRSNDLIGNVWRSQEFETHRQLSRVGGPVDRSEWRMTPQTVNAYYSPLQNEIVFPAGILQPPFFDPQMDDAVNYGGIGAVIGHEITHGYDDQGRKYDASGNLNDWWTEADAKAFETQAQRLVEQYNAYEPLPGLHLNGKLTLGENIADLGGVSIAYEALERALAKDPSKRKTIDGFTPEQRFEIAWAQVWRINCKEAETRRLVTVDPHSPGQFRAIGPLVNLQEFYDAFGVKEGKPLWKAPESRTKIW